MSMMNMKLGSLIGLMAYQGWWGLLVTRLYLSAQVAVISCRIARIKLLVKIRRAMKYLLLWEVQTLMKINKTDTWLVQCWIFLRWGRL